MIGSRRKCEDKNGDIDCNASPSHSMHNKYEKLMLGEGPCHSDDDCHDTLSCSAEACVGNQVAFSDYAYAPQQNDLNQKCCGLATYNGTRAIAFIPTTYEDCKERFLVE